ncbi:helix-turn-helix transcriptional regulator [Treponema sp.]|uniref:helix-turn-helix transcriptional regulator n=1 Tax=Treponema sp. TaxID=166 RepID=UPI00298EA14A|nr:helix-turn-helix transcriptional regulator [Treponema sp.]
MHGQFKLFFEKTYIIVVPTFKDTLVHHHNMLHVFFGNGDLKLSACGKEICGNVIILENDIEHKAPDGEIAFFLFVDPTSHFAEVLREKFLNGEPAVAVNLPQSTFDKASLTEESIKKTVFDFAGVVQLSKLNLDERILQILNNIDDFKHLGSRVSELADKYSYSESYLTHLFKSETGIALKSYLLMRQFEYVWREVMKGRSLTDASMDAGFSSPSHFSDVCRKLTGISVTKVLESQKTQ